MVLGYKIPEARYAQKRDLPTSAPTSALLCDRSHQVLDGCFVTTSCVLERSCCRASTCFLTSLTIEAASTFVTLASQSLTYARSKMSSIYGLMHVMQRYLSARLLVTFCMKGGYPLGKRRKTSKSRMTSGLLVFGDADDGMTNTSSSRIYNTLNCFAIK